MNCAPTGSVTLVAPFMDLETSLDAASESKGITRLALLSCKKNMNEVNKPET